MSAGHDDTEAGGPSPVLKARGLTRRFDGHAVLDGLDLTLLRGTTTALMGPSGAGKSTLLRGLAGLAPFDAGTVTLNGRPLGLHSPAWFRPTPASVGLVFQGSNLWTTMTPRENLVAPQVEVLRLSRAEATELALVGARRFGLEPLLDRPVAKLSFGERQRFALLRTVLLRPAVILLDEVTASLDAPMRHKVAAMIREIAAEGGTMLIATHEIGLVEQVADRLLFLLDGRFRETGLSRLSLDQPRTAELRDFLAECGLDRRPAPASRPGLPG